MLDGPPSQLFSNLQEAPTMITIKGRPNQTVSVNFCGPIPSVRGCAAFHHVTTLVSFGADL